MVTDDGASSQILDLDVVAAALLVPVRADDLMLGLDVLLQSILVGESVEVLENLLSRGINRGPVEFWLEAPRVVV